MRALGDPIEKALGVIDIAFRRHNIPLDWLTDEGRALVERRFGALAGK